MFPLHDDNPRHGTPLITLALIAVNLLVFVYELTLPPGALEDLFHSFGFIPARFSGEVQLVTDGHVVGGVWLTPITSMFLHAGWMHVVGNMWMLWLFGDNVEDRFGHLRFLIFYLACGLGATALHHLTATASEIPTVGASGAISGVMGAYFLLFPRARITTLVFLFFLVDLVQIPAVVFLGLWILIQVVSGSMTLGSAGDVGGVAFWAHVGGFGAGILLLPFMLIGRSVPRTALWRRHG
ncbi:MAG: rhomboid family intramembrane serine protease [Planctomycetota bacterium]|nr:MAG: rhomboid family intramembrane serine protease [Planctomycetota bacterium]